MKGRSFTSIRDLSTDEILKVFSLTKELKEKQKKGECPSLLKGKVIGMIFMKPSTRTRVSFEAGIFQLGGLGLYLSSKELQLGRGETVADTAKVLGRYVDGIVARTFSHEDIITLAENAGVPVINALSDLLHPCQAIADFYTLWEKGFDLKKLKLAYIGDGNNVANSLILGGAKLGSHVSVATPQGYEPNKDIVEEALEIAKLSGAKIEILKNPSEAVRDAHAVYTDVWASMGQEAEKEKRLCAFRDYQLNTELLQKARPDAVVMHCLPAHRGEEITSEVMDGPHSIIFDQAENRLHTQKAILFLVI